MPNGTGSLLSGLPDEQIKPTIGIITALEKEYAAVRAMLENTMDYEIPGRGAGRRYLLGELPAAKDRRHFVVLAEASMGNNIVAIRATLLTQSFPKVDPIIVVGIAGGIPYPQRPEEHVRLGDVVVSNDMGVVQYDFNKEEYDFAAETPIITHRPSPRPPSPVLLEAARLLQAAELRGYRSWLNHIHLADGLPEVERPQDDEDILADSDNPENVIAHPNDPKRMAGQPRVFLGPIASANRLLRNPKLRDALRDRFGVKAVEMEASGLADATWYQGISYFVVRGICDYCDSKKNNNWQGYAAVAAAAYMRGLLESVGPISHLW